MARRKTSGIAGRYSAMTIKIREWARGKRMGFEVDIRFSYPDGTPFRRRIKAPVESKSAAKRWGEAKERELLMRPSPVLLEQEQEKRKEIPTLKEFCPRFIDGYAKANRQKASTVFTKERILELHLVPSLGDRKLDAITSEDIAHLKARFASYAPKSINNVLNVLSKLLNVAVEWGVIERRPCTIKLLKTIIPIMSFYEDDQYERLVDASKRIDGHVHLMVLLGGDAGLRRGEIGALKQCDVDLRRKQLHVQRAAWRGIEDSPKGGRGRIIPMTDALACALGANRHLRGPYVLCTDDGTSTSENLLQDWMEQATRRAGLNVTRSLHILRHTFCSRLAMKGAPAKAIQELAGHQNLGTTLRYMHLSPAARESAIRLLNGSARIFGEIVETAPLAVAKA
jgi:integrase